MRIRIKIILSFFTLLILFFVGVWLFVAMWGKQLAVTQLEKISGKKVHIGDIYFRPPLTIVIKKIYVPNLAKVDYLSVSPSLLGLLTGRLAFNKVLAVGPEVTFENFPKQSQPLEAVTGNNTVASASPVPAARSSGTYALPRHLVFKQVVIRRGRINYIDHSVSGSSIKISLNDLDFYLNNFYTWPKPVVTNFKLKGRIPWQEGQKDGRIDLEGWANLYKKDMRAVLKIEGIDGVYLHPYYSTWVDLEKARIDSAKLNFISKLNSVNNNLTAECHLELTDIVRRPRPSDQPQEKAERLTDAVLDIFRSMNQGNVVLNFTIHTKMDRPEFGFGDIKMAFENKLTQGRKGSGFQPEDVLKLPGNLLIGALNGATDLTKGVLAGVAGVGKQLMKAVEDTFIKK